MCEMFVLKNFVLHDNLTRVQLCITCVDNIFLYLIFVQFVEYEIFLTPKISQITVIYTHVHVCICMISCIDNAYPMQADFDDDKIDVSLLSFFDRDDDEVALTWKKQKT